MVWDLKVNSTSVSFGFRFGFGEGIAVVCVCVVEVVALFVVVDTGIQLSLVVGMPWCLSSIQQVCEHMRYWLVSPWSLGSSGSAALGDVNRKLSLK